MPLNFIVYILMALSAAIVQPVHASTESLKYQLQQLNIGNETYQVKIPVGYQLEFLSKSMSGPRLLTFALNGDLFAGSKSGNVYRIPSPYTQPEILLNTDGYPHNVAFRANKIFVAKTDGVYSADYKAGQKIISAQALKRIAALPAGYGHNSRTVATGPDQRIYVSLGVAGNCSDQYLGQGYNFNDQRGGVLVLNEKNAVAGWQPYASGLRNPVGFDWHPQTKIMYASNNGPDHHGFEQPREYFSRLTPGSFHGMPWYQMQGDKLVRDTCVNSNSPRAMEEVAKPVASFPARSAPMAVAFINKQLRDEKLQGDAVVALHGSWGTKPTGSASGDRATRRHPKLVLVRFDKGKAVRVDDLVSGFQLASGKRWARPVGVAIGPEGAIYFTSDAGINGLFRLRLMTNN